LTERHKVDLKTESLEPVDLGAPLPADGRRPRARRLPRPYERLDQLLEPAAGAVFELRRGWLGPSHVLAVGKVLQSGRRALLWWPAEEAVEVVDWERLASYALLTAAAAGFRRVFGGIPPPRGVHAQRLRSEARELLD